MYVYICVYIQVYIWIYIYIFIYICVCKYTYIYTYRTGPSRWSGVSTARDVVGVYVEVPRNYCVRRVCPRAQRYSIIRLTVSCDSGVAECVHGALVKNRCWGGAAAPQRHDTSLVSGLCVSLWTYDVFALRIVIFTFFSRIFRCVWLVLILTLFLFPLSRCAPPRPPPRPPFPPPPNTFSNSNIHLFRHIQRTNSNTAPTN